MRNFQRIATGVNVTPLHVGHRPPARSVEGRHLPAGLPQGPFGEVDSIILRFPDRPKGFTEEDVELYKQNRLPGYDQHESVDQPVYQRLPEARAFVMNIFAAVGGERLGRVIINRIAPGGRIYPHPDTEAHVEYYKRFHLVLQSAEGVRFRCGDEWTYWEPGAVFWFNNALEHEVINESSVDRIHMVIDARCRK
jgi:hypothetical protein